MKSEKANLAEHGLTQLQNFARLTMLTVTWLQRVGTCQGPRSKLISINFNIFHSILSIFSFLSIFSGLLPIMIFLPQKSVKILRNQCAWLEVWSDWES